MRFDLESTLKGILKSMKTTQTAMANNAARDYPDGLWCVQKLNGKIKRKSITVDEYDDLLTASGVRIYYYDVKENTFFLPARKGNLRKVRGTHNHKQYSTEESFFVCGDVGKDSYEFDCATELYLDHFNNFFLAYYYEDYTGLKDRVVGISIRQAKDYMDLFLEDKSVWELMKPLLERKSNLTDVTE